MLFGDRQLQSTERVPFIGDDVPRGHVLKDLPVPQGGQYSLADAVIEAEAWGDAQLEPIVRREEEDVCGLVRAVPLGAVTKRPDGSKLCPKRARHGPGRRGV